VPAMAFPSVPASALPSPFRRDLLTGQVAIVTGGGTGIGRAIAHELALCGAQVAICGRRPEPLAAVAAEIQAASGVCIHKTCDIREPEQVAAFVSFVKAELGRIDILVNNAGGQKPFPASHMPLVNFEKVIKNNLIGTFSFTQTVAQQAFFYFLLGFITRNYILY